jgi:hypothetical protein
MRRVIVRYKVKPDRLAQHETLLRAVFAELAKVAPPGLRYGAFKQPDGVSFVHIAFVAVEKNPLDAIDAFRAFTANIGDRCDEPPAVVDLVEMGAYGL